MASETYRGVAIFENDSLVAPLPSEGSIVTNSLGGWLDHNTFAAGAVSLRNTPLGNATLKSSMSIGNATGSNPATRATWSGVMVGTDTGTATPRSSLVRGDADITLSNLNDPRIDVAFTRIRNVNGGGSRDDMRWNGLRLSFGRFKSGTDGNSIQGTFYGPNHEEVGGIFERNRVLGSFGAER